MVIDKIVEQTKQKKNPGIVGIDPEWSKIPDCYKTKGVPEAEIVLRWAMDVVDCVADVVVAVKPQMAFYEVYGADGVRIFERLVAYAHSKDLMVIDDSKSLCLCTSV